MAALPHPLGRFRGLPENRNFYLICYGLQLNQAQTLAWCCTGRSRAVCYDQGSRID